MKQQDPQKQQAETIKCLSHKENAITISLGECNNEQDRFLCPQCFLNLEDVSLTMNINVAQKLLNTKQEIFQKDYGESIKSQIQNIIEKVQLLKEFKQNFLHQIDLLEKQLIGQKNSLELLIAPINSSSLLKEINYLIQYSKDQVFNTNEIIIDLKEKHKKSIVNTIQEIDKQFIKFNDYLNVQLQQNDIREEDCLKILPLKQFIKKQSINVSVFIYPNQENLQQNIEINPFIPFNSFIQMIKKLIFLQTEQNIQDNDYCLDDNTHIEKDETKTLEELGFTHNSKITISRAFILYQHSLQNEQIQVIVVVNLYASQVQFQVNIDSSIPFTTFVDGIKQQIFAQKIQAQYKKTIEYSLQGVGTILPTDTRSLKALGFKAHSVLVVRSKLKYQAQIF